MSSLKVTKNDQTPIAQSPSISDVASAVMAEQIQINFNCEEIGQQIIFTGNGIQSSPVPFQCNSVGSQNFNLRFTSNFESNTNRITISGFDNSGNPNSANSSFNLPIDTKNPVLSVQSTGSLNQGGNTEFQVLYEDLNLPASFDYTVTLTGAISDAINCLSNPCVIQHSMVQDSGILTLSVSANAVTDTVGNVSSTTAVNFNYNILPAPDINLVFYVQGATSLDLGIKTSNGKSWKVNWGDLSPIETFSSSDSLRYDHTFLTPFSGEISISVAWDSEISGTLSGLPSGSKFIEISGENTLSGNISTLPTGLENLDLSGNSNLSGNVNSLPAGLKILRVLGQNNIAGGISSLPTSVNSIEILGQNTISGLISQIPSSITEFTIKGVNTISGSTNDLSANVSVFSLGGDGSLVGSIANLPAQLRVLEIDRNNNITGTISELPSNLEVIHFQSTTITGNISGFPQSLRSIDLSGTPSITGNFLSLPTNLEKFRLNLTNASGSINSLPSTLKEFEVIG